ncbi:MAG: hypothetical protein JW924_08275 [Fusobacteriaceae bacterium]|nr:hypothetical protein [Fusobacteriaceae bacterium]
MNGVVKEEKTQSSNKFFINTIEINNLKVLKKEVKKIRNTYENKELGMSEINSLVADLTNLYVKNGYITTRVMLTLPQNLNSGKLKLEIINGVIENFSL